MRTTMCLEVFSTSIRWYGSRGWTMISSSSSSHLSTAPHGTVTYPVTAGSCSAGSRTSSAGNAKCGRFPVR